VLAILQFKRVTNNICDFRIADVICNSLNYIIFSKKKKKKKLLASPFALKLFIHSSIKMAKLRVGTNALPKTNQPSYIYLTGPN